MEYIFLTRLKKFIPNWKVVKPYVLMQTRKVKFFSKSVFDVDDFLRKNCIKYWLLSIIMIVRTLLDLLHLYNWDLDLIHHQRYASSDLTKESLKDDKNGLLRSYLSEAVTCLQGSNSSISFFNWNISHNHTDAFKMCLFLHFNLSYFYEQIGKNIGVACADDTAFKISQGEKYFKTSLN